MQESAKFGPQVVIVLIHFMCLKDYDLIYPSQIPKCAPFG